MCATAYELIQDMANGRPPRAPQCTASKRSESPLQQTVRQPTNVAGNAAGPQVQLNPNLYTDIAEMPVLPPPSLPLFGTQSQIPAFATLGPRALHTFSQSEPTSTTIARQNAGKVSEWIRDNKAKLLGKHSERHKKALEYALENDEFKMAVASAVASRTVIPRHLLSAKEAEIINAIAHLAHDFDDIRRGNYYIKTLHIVNTVSSAALGILKPLGGGDVADGLNIAGSFVTAYTYGYFWGQ